MGKRKRIDEYVVTESISLLNFLAVNWVSMVAGFIIFFLFFCVCYTITGIIMT